MRTKQSRKGNRWIPVKNNCFSSQNRYNNVCVINRFAFYSRGKLPHHFIMGDVIMYQYRIASFCLALTIFLSLLTGCGTSQPLVPSNDDSNLDSSWVDLTPRETPPLESAPSVTTPSLDLPGDNVVRNENDVTADYIDSFVGTWDNADKSRVYVFQKNENLIVTSEGMDDTYTYWFETVGTQTQLKIYQNGAAAEISYTFTKDSTNLTLYSTETGSIAESLTKRIELPSPSPKATVKPTATAAPTTAPTVVPTAAPSAIPSTVPTEAPAPTVPPTEAPQIEVPPIPTPIVTIELNSTEWKAMPAVCCALEAMLTGATFSPSDSSSFWGIMVRYLAPSVLDSDGTFTISESRIRSAAKEVFASFTDGSSIPACPAGTDLVTMETGADGTVSYIAKWGADADILPEISGRSEAGNILLTSSGTTYEVVLSDSGAIVSMNIV